MKRHSRPSLGRMSGSIHQQLNMYALAASAAGVSLLALAQPAGAKIVYTPANVKISFGQMVPLDVNHDGVNDFFFSNKSFSAATFLSYLDVGGLIRGNAVVLQVSGGENLGAADLKAGVRVGPKTHFSHSSAPAMARFCTHPGSGTCPTFFGPWAHDGRGVKNRYVGLKFAINGQVHYGWARLSVSIGAGGHDSIVGHLTGYAYETIANKPIITGQTKNGQPKGLDKTDHNVEALNRASAAVPAPKPATLALLAIGAPAFSARRRENSAIAMQ